MDSVSEQSRVVSWRPGFLGASLFTLTLVTGAAQCPLESPPPIGQPAHRGTRDTNVYLDGKSSCRGFTEKFTTNLLLDQKEIWTSPFRINRSSAKWWILAGLGTASLIAADHPISQALPFSGTSVDFGEAASRAGAWYTVYPAAGALFVIGGAFNNKKLQETGILGLQALTDADIVVNVLKVATRRERPTDGDHGGHFEKGGNSFPSGHSAQAWSMAAVVASEYGNHRWVPYVSYGYGNPTRSLGGQQK
jgi:hypothetical protein